MVPCFEYWVGTKKINSERQDLWAETARKKKLRDLDTGINESKGCLPITIKNENGN